jgi:hypothetical protein
MAPALPAFTAFQFLPLVGRPFRAVHLRPSHPMGALFDLRLPSRGTLAKGAVLPSSDARALARSRPSVGCARPQLVEPAAAPGRQHVRRVVMGSAEARPETAFRRTS